MVNDDDTDDDTDDDPNHPKENPMSFKRATKTSTYARVALLGPAGSGKTYTAFRLAHQLADGGEIAVFDTERGSASKYAGDPNPDGGVFEFLVQDDMTDFAPKRYIQAIRDAEAAGCKVIVFDSLSHAWAGPGGILEFVDNKKAASNSANSYTAWRDATPLHNALVDALLSARLHVIVTMRTKMEYTLEEDSKGKKVPRKVGLQPIQRDGVEYEFDLIVDMDQAIATVSKSRCPTLAAKRFNEPGADMAKLLIAWLTAGAPRESVPQASSAPRQPEQRQQSGNQDARASEQTLANLVETLRARVTTWKGYELAEPDVVRRGLEQVLGKSLADLTEAQANAYIAAFGQRTDEQLLGKFAKPLADLGVTPF